MEQLIHEASPTPTARKTGLFLRWIARSILLAGAAFWSFFCIADGIGDARELGPMGFVMMLPAMVVALAVLYVAWRWEFAGAILLLVVTALGGWFVAMNMRQIDSFTWQNLGGMALLLAIFILPFLAPAVLLLIKLRLDRA